MSSMTAPTKQVCVSIDFEDQLHKSDFKISASEHVEYNTIEVERIIEELLGYFEITNLTKVNN